MINLLAIVVAAEEEAGDPPNPVIPVENEIVWAAIFFFAFSGWYTTAPAPGNRSVIARTVSGSAGSSNRVPGTGFAFGMYDAPCSITTTLPMSV